MVRSAGFIKTAKTICKIVSDERLLVLEPRFITRLVISYEGTKDLVMRV